MQQWKTAYKEAGRVFLLSRLLLLVVSVLTMFSLQALLPFFRNQSAMLHTPYQVIPYGDNPASLSAFFFSWYRWDVPHFVAISAQGYADTLNTAFFPLWPLLQRPVGLLLGGIFPGSYYAAGLLLANLCFYCALVLLSKLLLDHYDAVIARRALYYMAFAPYGLFFFAGYTESLFMLLCIACFLVLQRGQPRDWWFAGLLGFLAALTRSSGVFLAVPYLVVYAQRFWISSEQTKHAWRAKLNALIPIALIPLGVIIYLLYLYFTKGNAFVFSVAEKNDWNRHFSFPWTTAYLIVRGFVAAPSWIYLLEHLNSFLFTLFSLLVLGFGWKWIPLHYRLFAASIATFSLSFPLEDLSPLLSQPRYLLILFPIFVIAAVWGKKSRRFHRWYFTGSLFFFIAFSIMFICNLWVA
ncbi:MAG TPA: mannosyltransferase family protein [Ktedonobacteraceae bacterium]|jgi:hypothetical protein|nr:mannosyltransferase family protein [Ktedonobacteraceae bacterium]